MKTDYDLFCECMQRYKDGERGLNEEEKKWKAHMVSAGVAFQSLPYETFLHNMRRYEAGERENSEEKNLMDIWQSTGIPSMTSSYSTFLKYMEMYQSEKIGERQM